MSPLPEYKFLLLSVRYAAEEEVFTEVARLISEGISWDDLLRQARLHAVTPLVAKLIAACDLTAVPSEVREKLKTAHADTLHSQLAFAGEFMQIYERLASESIVMVPFKGFWLAWDAYGNLADREGGDVDVYLPLRHLEQVRDLMLSYGYRVEAAYQGLTRAEVMKMSQEYTFERVSDDKTHFRIEFHWGIAPPAYGMDVRYEDLEDQIVPGLFQGRKIMVFTPSAQMLLLLLHHGGDDRFIRLKQVADITMMLKRRHDEIDWPWVMMMAGRFDAADVVSVGLRLANELAGVDLPDSMVEATESRRITRLAAGRARSLSRPAEGYFSKSFLFGNWLFRMHTRNGPGLKLRMTFATLRALMASRTDTAK